jgi:hypothetical protein
MRSRLAMCAVIVLGLALGFGVGFATSVVRITLELPFLANPDSTRDNFTSVFRAMDRLAAAEMTAASCGGRRSDPLPVEEYAIRAIQERSAAAGLNPPLDVARATLALRRAMLAEKNGNSQLKTQYEATAQQLLEKSGWKDPSPDHLREILRRMDMEGQTCSAGAAKAGQSK